MKPQQDRLPPSDTEAEMATLGSILMDSEVIKHVASVLTPDDFYRLKHHWVYAACLALHKQGEVVDQVTVQHELGREDRLESIGGWAFLAQLVATVPTPLHIVAHAKLVKETSMRRQLIGLSGQLAAKAYNSDAVEVALWWGCRELARLQDAWTQARQDIEKAKVAIHDGK